VVISGITPSGKLLMQVYEHSIRGEQVVDFLRHLPGKLLIIWDGASIHCCEAVKYLLAAGGAWNACRATRRISIPMKVSGSTSNTSNFGMSSVQISKSYATNSVLRPLVFARNPM
jgi:hypothetical protein